MSPQPLFFIAVEQTDGSKAWIEVSRISVIFERQTGCALYVDGHGPVNTPETASAFLRRMIESPNA